MPTADNRGVGSEMGRDVRRQKLAQFIHTLALSRPGMMGLRLAGSWANNEAFIKPRKDGGFESLSDIDFTCTHIRSLTDRDRMLMEIQESARSAGIRLHGRPSIRDHEVMARLPHGAEWSLRAISSAPMPEPAPRSLILFWAAIGAIEAEIAVRRSASADFDHKTLRSYAFSKFAFGLFRNVAVARGHPFKSYRGITQWVAARWPHVPIVSAYRVKTGKSVSLCSNDADGLIRGYLSCFDLQTAFPTVSFSLLCGLLHHVRELFGDRSRSNIASLVDLAERLSYSEITDEVIEHERQKSAVISRGKQL